ASSISRNSDAHLASTAGHRTQGRGASRVRRALHYRQAGIDPGRPPPPGAAARWRRGFGARARSLTGSERRSTMRVRRSPAAPRRKDVYTMRRALAIRFVVLAALTMLFADCAKDDVDEARKNASSNSAQPANPPAAVSQETAPISGAPPGAADAGAA